MQLNLKALLNQPKNIFLIDGLGALLSAALLGILGWVEISGMPVGVLTMLATIAGLFAAYSLNCYLFVRNNWRRYLGVIMTANVLYCLLSVGLTVKYYELLTPVGIAYFAGEVVVIGVLVGVERKRLILYST